jgi:glycerol-3-phosphate dehydrogenase (NAD(P)+)
MKIGIIGAGTWGTALGHLLASGGNNVNLWARRPEVVESVNGDHRNPRHLADYRLSENIVATVAYEDCLRNAAAVVVATPSRLMRGVARALSVEAAPDLPVVVCTAGLEEESRLFPLQVFEQEMGNPARLAVMAGPAPVDDLMLGLPTAAAVASRSPSTARFFRNLFTQRGLQVAGSSDVVGLQVCAAMTEVASIAAGLSRGMGYGDGAAALVMTHAQREMSRLASVLGADPVTSTGLAGTGGLVSACTAPSSIGRQLGSSLVNGETLDDFTARANTVPEGARACKELPPLAERYGVKLPLVEAVRSILWGGADARTVVRHLLARPLDHGYDW